MKGISARRTQELRRLKVDAERVLALFLAGDAEEPKIFDSEGRAALRHVLGTVVKCESIFGRLGTLRSARAKAYWRDWLCVDVLASIESYDAVKVISETLRGMRQGGVMRMVASESQLMKLHSELFRRMRRPERDGNARLGDLLSLIRLEIVWLGYTW